MFEAAEQFARVEGILPAPESSHAIKVAIDEALKCRETGEEKTIVFGLTGTGYFDMYAYEKFNNGEMTDYIPTDEDLAKGFAGLPSVPEKLNAAGMKGYPFFERLEALDELPSRRAALPEGSLFY